MTGWGRERGTAEDTPVSDGRGELRSFTRWARSLGEEPGGRVVALDQVAADEEEAERLRLESGAFVYRVRRLRTLSGTPAMVERTTYPERSGEVEWSQDRYLPGTVAFTVQSSTATSALGRRLDL
ncbi:UTRA domain-containing protein [Streptomyces sp. NPDC001717]|uniref:UTRA domain-containing protein n=1 Tax=Streptomyces sp. NPDC001717 TaxID=3364604 RepID=UPI0036BBEDB1